MDKVYIQSIWNQVGLKKRVATISVLYGSKNITKNKCRSCFGTFRGKSEGLATLKTATERIAGNANKRIRKMLHKFAHRGKHLCRPYIYYTYTAERIKLTIFAFPSTQQDIMWGRDGCWFLGSCSQILGMQTRRQNRGDAKHFRNTRPSLIWSPLQEIKWMLVR